MKHRVVGRKLGRTSAHRLALLRNLSTSLFEKERIRTTLMKAKELRPFAERLVTLGKREGLHARRQVLRHIHDVDVVAKLFDTLSARYAQRPGGYTRIIKVGPRRGDNAEMAIVELVGAEPARPATPPPPPRTRRRRGPAQEGEGAAAEAGAERTERKDRKGGKTGSRPRRTRRGATSEPTQESARTTAPKRTGGQKKSTGRSGGRSGGSRSS